MDRLFRLRKRQKDKDRHKDEDERIWDEALEDSKKRSDKPPPINKEFSEALKRLSAVCAVFRDSLTPEENILYSDIHDCDTLLKDLEAECQETKGSEQYGNLYKCFGHVERFSLKLRPFFGVVDMFVSSHPEYAAIVWGGIKLLFVLAKGYIQLFEKVGAMLETLAENIPNYQRQLADVRRFKEANRVESMAPLLRAISHVYRDVVGFIRESCSLFIGKKGKVRSSMEIFFLNIWKPLDMYLDEITTRLRDHQELVRSELTSVRLDITLKKLEALEIDEDTREDHEKVEFLEELRRTRARQISRFLDAPSWDDQLWNISRRRIENTGNWLFDHPEYQKWIGPYTNGFDSNNKEIPACLTIRAKPGYGKTFLCAHTIRHLQSKTRDQRTLSKSTNGPLQQLAYFFFSRFRERCEPSDALRAIAAQLFEQNSEDWSVIKSASLVLDNKFRSKASIMDLLGLLRLLVQQSQQAIWIFDAVDECPQAGEFLTYLRDVTSVPVSHTSEVSAKLQDMTQLVRQKPAILIFTRPDTIIPREFTATFHPVRVDLDGQDNHQDINSFATVSLQNLWKDGILTNICSYEEINDLSTRVTLHSSGMFLWVDLFMTYLSSELLSHGDRCSTLRNLKFLEGLDGLYGHILVRLASGHSKTQLDRIKNAFRWTARTVATSPLSLAQLQDAISISPGDNFSELDVVHLSKDLLSRISGALLEVGFGNSNWTMMKTFSFPRNLSPKPPREIVPVGIDPSNDGSIQLVNTSAKQFVAQFGNDEYVRPIHASVIDYLRDLAFAEDTVAIPKPETIFALHRGVEEEVYFMRCCLTYVRGCVTPGPLSGDVDVTPSVQIIRTRYPFLEYATNHWTAHAQNAIEIGRNLSDDKSGRNEKALQLILSEMKDFMMDTKIVRRWIEASFLFGAKPSISGLLATSKKALMSFEPGTDIRLAFQYLSKVLSELSRDIESLIEGWSEVLEDTPNEIWSESIPAFLESRFWATTKTKARRLHRGHDGDVLIDSAVSADGLKLGLVRLKPPEKGSRMSRGPEFTPYGWQAIYEIWDIEEKKLSAETQVDIPTDHMARVLAEFREPAYLHGAAGFLELDDLEQVADFHVAFSRDLMRVLILGSLVVLSETSDQLPINVSTANITAIKPWRRPDSQNSLDLRGFTAQTWPFRALFHPTDQYLLVLRPGQFDSCEFAIFQTGSKESTNPRCSISIPWDMLMFPKDDSQLYGLFCFHPFRPILVISQIDCVIAWSFLEKGLTVAVRHNRMRELKFSSCGRYIKGYEQTNYGFQESMIVVDFNEVIEKARTTDGRVIPTTPTAPTVGALLTTGINFHSENFQETGVTHFKLNEESNTRQASLMHRVPDQHAVVLHTLNSDGTSHVETMTRIPQDVDLNDAIRVPVRSSDGQKKIRLVLTRKQHWSFTLRDERPYSAPIILERVESTIPRTLLTQDSRWMRRLVYEEGRMI